MIERSRVRIPAGTAGEFYSPGSTGRDKTNKDKDLVKKRIRLQTNAGGKFCTVN